jgi:hypothetical protein
MAKPSKKTIEPLLQELAQLKLRALGIELQHAREIKPHKDRYEKAIAETVATAKTRLDSINARLSVLTKEINAQLLEGVDEKTGKIALREVSVELETTKAIAAAIAKANGTEADDRRESENGKPAVLAVASVDGKPGNREIEPQKFFKHVEESKRGAEFWGCYKVQIAPAEKLLGKSEIDKLAVKPTNYNVEISLKS